MKESSFYSDDFEQLIREKTEQYKMYPSERVWKGVHSSLHTKRKWFIGSMSLLVTGILFFAGRELISPSSRSVATRKPATTAASMAEAQKPWLAAHAPHNSLASLHSSSSSSATRHSIVAENDEADNADNADPEYKGISITLSHPVMDPSDLSGWVNRVQLPDHAPDLPVIAARTIAPDAVKTPEDGHSGNRSSAEIAANHESADGSDPDALNARGVLESLGSRGTEATRNARMHGRLAKNNGNPNSVAAGDLQADAYGSASASAAAIAEAQDKQRINWLHDYAMNTLPQSNRRGRTFFQLTLAPTLNYRTLNKFDPSLEKWGPLPGFSMTPGQIMNSSSAFGFEFGGSILYRLTRNLSVKGGLQFNFARYKITAYSPNGSTAASQSSSLNSYYGYMVDSLTRPLIQQRANGASSYSTAQTLNNDYLQLSAPIGFELRVLGNERLQFNLGATVQPSYLVGTTSYLLTDGMTKYSKNPNLYRKWNVSGGIEAFLSYRVGNIRWQVGPEFRYQVLSTYTSQSQISENLKTYGLKIGITKVLP